MINMVDRVPRSAIDNWEGSESPMAKTPDELELHVTAGLVVRPGDSLILGVRGHLTVEQATTMTAIIKNRLPGLADVVVVPAVALAAYRPEDKS